MDDIQQIYSELDEISNKTDSLDEAVSSLKTKISVLSVANLKGEKGDKGNKGDTGLPGFIPVKGIDYNDGKDGKTPVKGVDYEDGKTPTNDELLNLINPLIPVIDIEEITVSASKIAVEEVKAVIEKKDTGQEIIDKINELEPKPEYQIDARHIKNLPIPFSQQGRNGSGGGSADLVTYIRNAFSARVYEMVNVTTVEEALDFIFNFSYVAPFISLVGIPDSSIREFGNSLASIILNATTTKTSDPITQVKFYRGASLINTVASPDPAGGTETYTESTPITATTSFTATVGDGTSTVTSNAVTISFVYPFYYGVGAVGLTAVQIQALTKEVKAKSNTAVITSPSNQVYYFAYPASYGDLTSILDTNGFETLYDYTKTVVAFTMLDATSQNYNVYEFHNLTTQTLFTNTYIF